MKILKFSNSTIDDIENDKTREIRDALGSIIPNIATATGFGAITGMVLSGFIRILAFIAKNQLDLRFLVDAKYMLIEIGSLLGVFLGINYASAKLICAISEFQERNELSR